MAIKNTKFKSSDLENMFVQKGITQYSDLPILTDGKESERRDTYEKWLEVFLEGIATPKTEITLEGGGRADLVLERDGKRVVFFEFKKKIKINKNRDQGIRYLISVLRSNPTLRSVVLIITDGFRYHPMIGTLSSDFRPEFIYEREARVMVEW